MHLYEKCLADIEAIDEKMIAELREYHEETKCLVKYYYLDIPSEICSDLNEFDDDSVSKLLGADWHKFIFDKYEKFCDEKKGKNLSEKCLKAMFANKIMTDFYDEMESIFREGFGTSGKTANKVAKGVTKLLFSL